MKQDPYQRLRLISRFAFCLRRLWWWNKIFRLLLRISLLAELIRLVMMALCVLVRTRLFEWPLSRVLLQPRPYSALTALPFSNFYIIHAHSICAWNIKNALWGHILSFKRACFVCSLISVTQRPYISGDFPRCLLGSLSLAAIISWSLLTALPHFTEITKHCAPRRSQNCVSRAGVHIKMQNDAKYYNRDYK